MTALLRFNFITAALSLRTETTLCSATFFARQAATLSKVKFVTSLSVSGDFLPIYSSVSVILDGSGVSGIKVPPTSLVRFFILGLGASQNVRSTPLDVTRAATLLSEPLLACGSFV